MTGRAIQRLTENKLYGGSSKQWCQQFYIPDCRRRLLKRFENSLPNTGSRRVKRMREIMRDEGRRVMWEGQRYEDILPSEIGGDN